MDQIKRMIKEYYGMKVSDVLPVQGGWAALAFKVQHGHQSYFLKMYDKKRASTPTWTAHIEDYVPITDWLNQNSTLKGKIAVPLLTKNGEYKCEDEHGIYLLYDYIKGKTIGERDLTMNEVHLFSKIVSELHSFGEDIPFETDAIKEDFEVPFLQSLRNIVQNGWYYLPSDVMELIRPHLSSLKETMSMIEELSDKFKRSYWSMALCHTDLHHWNLMKSGNQLMLIDWEGLKLAPVEADLMGLVDQTYWNEFFKIYRKNHQNFSINYDAMTFYIGKRRLEDIWEFIEQILYDDQNKQERINTINHLQAELMKMHQNL